jgi:YfiH family protein
MLLKSINSLSNKTTNSTIEFVQWPTFSSIGEKIIDEKVFAIQTTRLPLNNITLNKASPYQSFNLGLHVGDSADHVIENRNNLQKLLPENSQIQWFEQVHGNNVAEVTSASKQAIVADAAITRKKNTCLAIMTADCLPILLVSKSGGEVAAIHGGWRPLAANIIFNTIKKMNTPAEDIIAWLGPCISQKAFEVGGEVKATFLKQGTQFQSAFIGKNNGKYFADLHKLATLQLELLGVRHISALPECTYSTPEKYYSYRKNSITGRMASLICLL